jgi:phosphatidylglycerol:prolipoprotein diacylglycerol transferase
LATPTIAFWKSPSPKPTARSIARFGERAAPWVMVLLLQLSATGKTPDSENQLRFACILLESAPRPPVLVHPNFDPVAISLGPIAIRWYGLMYLVGFAISYGLGRLRIARAMSGRVTVATLDDLLFFCVLGVVLGGRLGYVLFYKPAYYFSHPLEIFAVWQGGMSFHGGFLGVLLAIAWVARKHGLRWIELTDFFAPLAPLALGAGRIGNFINGELPGRVTDMAWGMLFRGAGPLPRHPSQLYQFALEGVLLFAILWVYSAKPRPTGAVSGAFLLGYGVFRFGVEYFREPDDFLGLLAFNLSMGQWLSAPMIALGIGMLVWTWRKRQKV